MKTLQRRILSLVFLCGAGCVLAQGEPNTWNGNLSLGAVLTAGNSDTFLGNVGAMGERDWGKDLLRLGINGSYGERKVDGEREKTIEQIYAYVIYQHLFSDRFYVGAKADVLHDTIADLEYRFTIGPNAGYYFIKKESTKLSADAGVAFVYEKSGGDEASYWALRLGERFDQKIGEWGKFWQLAELLPQVDRPENFLLMVEVGLEASLNKRLALRVVGQDRYDNEPAPGREKNDLTISTSLVYNF